MSEQHGIVIHGDVHGSIGSFGYVHGSAGPPSGIEVLAGPVHADEIDEARATFVEPERYPLAAQVLERRHVVVLCGAAGSGRRSAGLNLLAARGAERIIALEPEDARELVDYPYAAGCGYLVDAADPGWLGATRLNRLSETLAAQESWLVLCTEHADELVEAARRGYAVSLAPPPPAPVLERHLARAMRDTTLAAWPNELDMTRLHALLPDGTPPAAVARAAHTVVGALHGQYPLDDAFAVVRDEDDATVRNWLGPPVEPDRAALLIAVAAFEGFDFELVAQAADRLRVLLEAGESSSRPPFQRGQRELLADAGARLTPRIESSPSGRHRLELVTFVRPRRGEAVLRVVWREHRDLRPKLLEWLGDVEAHHGMAERAAEVAGRLVGGSTGYDVAALLDPWASSDDDAKRALAAEALGVAARDRVVGTQVRARLAAWAASGGTQRATTAVLAYGGTFGRARPHVALDRLEALARRRTDLSRCVVDSLVSLLRDADLRDAVIARLSRLSDDSALSATVFRAVAAALDPGASNWGWTRRAKTRADEWVAGGDAAARLLVRALDDRTGHVEVTNALWALCRAGHADARTGESVTALLGEVLKPPGTGGVRWLADDLAGRMPAGGGDEFLDGIRRMIRGFRALDTKGPRLYQPEPAALRLLLAIRSGWERKCALVVSRPDGSLVDERPGHRGVRLMDVLRGRYQAAYRVPLADRSASFPVDLPNRSVDIRLTWRISDPAQVVKRRMTDGAGYIHRTVENRVRSIARRQGGDLQQVLRAELARGTELPEAGLTYSQARVWVPDAS